VAEFLNRAVEYHTTTAVVLLLVPNSIEGWKSVFRL
jgi:hypothetical protein